jgi:dCMP deaminase
MQVAEVMSRRSTCFRRNVGAVITVDHHIISVGYNGPPSGEPHCTGNGCADPKRGCTRAIHAEKNAIAHRPEITNAGIHRMYVTESPCADCANAIVEDGLIDSVYFLHQYRLTEGCDILVRAGVSLFRVTPAGHVVYYETNQLVDDTQIQ